MVALWDRRRRVRLLALQDPEAERLLADLTATRRLERVHLLLPGGERRSGGDAIAPLLSRLPGGGPPAAAARRFPGAARRSYELAARNRGKLARPIPGPLRDLAARHLRARQA